MAKRHWFSRSRGSRKIGFSIEEINDIVRVMDENRLAEVTFQEKNRKLSLKRATAEPAGVCAPATVEEPSTVSESSLTAITSPTVGIFYSSPAPDEPPFVTEGQLIEPDQVIALIETLKVMSEVRALSHGRVISIEARTGEMVEFGQTLVLCEDID